MLTRLDQFLTLVTIGNNLTDLVALYFYFISGYVVSENVGC